MQLFYTPSLSVPLHTLSEEESRHAIKVLRLKVGDKIFITDGSGDMHQAKITDANAKHCAIEIIETQHDFERRDYKITVAVAPTKNNDRLEWFAEKATEVGIDKIIPILTTHSERKIFNKDRLEKVVVSALKQSLKAYKPQVENLTNFKEAVETKFEGVKLIAHCHDVVSERRLIQELVKKQDNVLILIGPEGDFSPEEVKLAFDNGFAPVSLGKARLRTETAALSVVMNLAFINS
ncbi:MAG: 16S rRNA (uracil(1498)-N(3))-methyltransferase [Rikenellaceae bacterium]